MPPHRHDPAVPARRPRGRHDAAVGKGQSPGCGRAAACGRTRAGRRRPGV